MGDEADFVLTFRDHAGDEELRSMTIILEGDDIEWLLVNFFQRLRQRRKEQLICKIIRGMYEGNGGYEYPQWLSDGMDKLIEAACDIDDGWDEYDKELNEMVERMPNQPPVEE